jgi:hypothetical protein
MTFQLKSYTFINQAIKRAVEHIKANAKKQCFFVNLKNATFWKKTPRGNEIVIFFKEMNDNQIIQFFGFFDIFFVGYQNGINGFISMTANPSNPKFEHTVFISISKGYGLFKEFCPLRPTTPSIDLRSSIGDSQSPIQNFGEEFSTSPFGSDFSSVDRAFGQDATRFGGGPANSQYSPFQQQGPSSFGGGPANSQYSPFQQQGPSSFGGGPAIGGGHVSNFSFFSSQPPTALGGNATHQSQFDRTPVCSLFDQKNPFTSNADFVPVQETSEPLRRQEQLKIVKGRVIRVEVQIPSDCSSGPSTSSTVGVGGIAKKSPRTQTPIATTIANLEKKISKLKSQDLCKGSLDFLELETFEAKLKKIRNSL